ncbi:MAG: S49 family peptidase [Phycisphaerales bacterium]
MRLLSRVAAVVSGFALIMSASARDDIGLITIEGTPTERPAPLAWLLGTAEPTLHDIIDAIGIGASDGNDHLVIRLRDASLTATQVQEIGAAIKRARSGGGKVTVFAEGYDATGLLLGSYADSTIIQSGGEVSLPGLFMEEMYLADTLAWIGVKADLVQVGDYKGANEMFVNSAPSKAWDQNINGLLDGLYANLRAELKRGRGLSDERLDSAMKTAWMATADDAIKAGLIDKAVDFPDLGKAVTGGASADWHEVAVGTEGELTMDTGNPLMAMTAMMSLLTKEPPNKAKSPTIAVLHIDGAIVDGDSTEGGFLGSESTVGSRTIRNALESIREQEMIKGVVVRIDSPGGSATASEVIWQGLRRVAAEKPVWVSVGSMAASGGYYIAVAGDTIYVNPSSIVGSIGVVGGKISMGGLYDMLKVKVVGRGRGPMAGMFDTTRPWTPDELAMVRGKMKQTYDLFTSRVSAGRKGIDLDTTAEGRLFTGHVAIERKMADKIGGLEDAVSDLAASLRMESYEVMHFPGAKSIPQLMDEMFGVSSSRVRAGGGSDVVAAARMMLGEPAWRDLTRSWSALMQLRREPVVLAMPRTIRFR